VADREGTRTNDVLLTLLAIGAIGTFATLLYMVLRRPKEQDALPEQESQQLLPPMVVLEGNMRSNRGTYTPRTFSQTIAVGTRAIAIAAAPTRAGAKVEVRCVGPAGQFVMVGRDGAATEMATAASPYGYITVLGAGTNPDEFELGPKQTLYAKGSAAGVIISVKTTVEEDFV
jgi:hypothetical protein